MREKPKDESRLRHVLVHGYYQIRDEIVWATIKQELSPLKQQVQNILKEL